MNLQPIYQQCNDHLKETDKKRDQILGFYVLMTGLFFNAINNLGVIYNKMVFLLALLGVLFAIVLIHYRKWHILYVNSAIVLQYLMLMERHISKNDLELTWKKMILPYRLKRLIWSTESIVFNVFLIITFPTVFLTIVNLLHCTALNTKYGFLLIFIGYLVLFNIFCIFMLKKSIKLGTEHIWILRFVD